MAATVAIRFPLGRYHATPWDRSVNEGVVEWPPSPWRLLRALVATWYTRWPDLPAPSLDALLDALGDPPSYRTPPVRPGHTRHYLPDLNHKKGETGATDLTLDPYLALGRDAEVDAEVLVQWDVDLTAEQRATLAKLVELLPYLGRAESVCEARVLDTDPVPDETWWRPGATGTQTARLLAPAGPVRRPLLEMSTVEVRKARRTVPPETTWVSYARTVPASPPVPHRNVLTVEAVRFAVMSRAPVKATHGILLADEVHRIAARKLTDDGGRDLLGRGGAATDHRHAHWVPVATGAERGATVDSLLVWVPQGLRPDEVATIVAIRHVSGRRRGRGDDVGYEIRGFPPAELLLQAAGPVGLVAPELYGPARRWRSRTPYLPVRHRKRESLDEYVSADVGAELRYRELPRATVTRVDPDDRLSDRWARDFRRYRLNEHLGKARRGLGLRLEFAEEVPGPVLLGQLSHFGYGIFVPDLG
jgi:CRISPR-associated protein Csb2